MNLYWQNDEALIKVYNGIDNLALEGQLRPIVFIIATNRKFDFTSFEQSLLDSLKSSAICKTKGFIHLFIGDNNFIPSKNTCDFLSVKRVKMDSHELNKKDDIGCIRQFQRKLAREACENFEDPILVIMDDDLRFESLMLHNGQLQLGYPFSYVHEIYNFSTQFECDVALGSVTGSPPLPATSCMRTFLQDFLSAEVPQNNSENWNESDYYYDLSETRTNWSAWKIIQKPDINQNNAEYFLNQMFFTCSNNRPLIITQLPSDKVPYETVTRGGNTVIFNSKYITEIVHPKLPRRGDSIWSILALEKNAKILKFSAPLYHDRGNETYDNSNLKQRMIDDIFGASLQRAMLQNLDDFEKILSDRINRQLEMIDDCLRLINLIENTYPIKRGIVGTFWGLSKKEQRLFIKTAKSELVCLKNHLIHYSLTICENVEKGTILAKSLRYDLAKVMIK